MDADAQAVISELQFVIARILWAPYCDRERAMVLAELAARRHPDPVKRAAMADWMRLRQTPPLDDVAVAHLRRELRAASQGDTKTA